MSSDEPNISNIETVASISADRIQSLLLRNLLGYWQSKENSLGRLPMRTNLRPDEMVPFLPFVALINVQHNTTPCFQFRLVGTGIVSSMGRETTNRPVDESLFGGNAMIVEAFFNIPVQTRGPAYARGKYTVAPSGRLLDFETILLPLLGEAESIDMLLGGLVGQRIQRDEQICGFQYDYYCPVV